MIPHKIREFRAILDLSFALKVAWWDIPSGNEERKETAPNEALEKVVTVIPRIIEAFATSPLPNDPIHFSKLDIKDGLWRMVCAVGE